MSWMSLIAIIVATPLAVLAVILGLLHMLLAVSWAISGEKSPSAIPLFGFIIGPALLLLGVAMDPKWAKLTAAGACAVCLLGELALLTASAIISMTRKWRRPRA